MRRVSEADFTHVPICEYAMLRTCMPINQNITLPCKVDREERPDVDRVYMSYVQATTGSGGWPMSVWLTPDLEPIYGGTYYPKVSSTIET